jgi:hypothetical protein
MSISRSFPLDDDGIVVEGKSNAGGLGSGPRL